MKWGRNCKESGKYRVEISLRILYYAMMKNVKSMIYLIFFSKILTRKTRKIWFKNQLGLNEETVVNK